MPLFPGYIFCSTKRSSIVPVLMTSGVIDVVRAGTNPLPADKAEIEALQQTVSVDVPIEAWPYTEVGEAGSFSILRGPLAGLTGILVEVRRAQRLILSVNLLRRSVLVEVDPEWVHHMLQKLWSAEWPSCIIAITLFFCLSRDWFSRSKVQPGMLASYIPLAVPMSRSPPKSLN